MYGQQMKTYVVTVSDASNVDRLTPVSVKEETSLGKVAQMAVDEFIETHGDDVQFPLFIDIHPAAEFRGVHWLHGGPSVNRTASESPN